MLARILHSSPELCAFLDPLIESLSKPQRAHLRELCDAVLVCETEHTLAAMQRLFVETTDPSNWADFLRISPWEPDAVRAELLKAQIDWAIEHGQKSGQATEIYLNFDDSRRQRRTTRPGDWMSWTGITIIRKARRASRATKMGFVISPARCAWAMSS